MSGQCAMSGQCEAVANRTADVEAQAAADGGPRKRSKWGAPAGASNAGTVAPAPSTGNPYADFVAMRSAADASSNGRNVT